MTRTRRAGLRASEIAATVVVVVLAVVGLIAFWPRDHVAPARPVDTVGTASEAELAPVRAKAQLAECPRPAPGAPPARGPLAGVVVPCLGGPGQVDLGTALAGRVAVLNLWASWCEPCRRELPVLESYAARPGAVPVLGVDIRDDPRSALALLADLGVRLPSVTDPDGILRAALDAPQALPVSFVVRADGGVVRIDPPVPLRTPDEVAAAVGRYAGTGA